MTSSHRIALVGAGPVAIGVALRLVQAGHREFAVYDGSSKSGAGALPFSVFQTAVRGARWDAHAQHWELDTTDGLHSATVLLANGVDSPIDALTARIHGRLGTTLEEAWLRQQRPHSGATFVGFPNFFLIPGPVASSDRGTVTERIEGRISLVLGALEHLTRTRAVALEPREPDKNATHVTSHSGGSRGLLATRKRHFVPSDYALEERRNAPVTLPLKSRFEGLVGRLIAALPRAVLAPRPLVRSGFRLEPELQAILAVRGVTGSQGLTDISIVASRSRLRRDAVLGAGTVVEVGAVRSLRLSEHLFARHYSPRTGSGSPTTSSGSPTTSSGSPTTSSGSPTTSSGTPLVVFFHGGGFVLGDLESHDAPCRVLCREAGVQVLAVDYRLAPENPHPAAVLDGVFAYEWACTHARELGCDPGRIVVAGDSAGGNLAAVVAQEARRRGLPRPALQLLLYPTVDRTRSFPSVEAMGKGYFLEASDLEWFSRKYRGEHYGTLDVTADPGLEQDLAGLAPALIVTAGFDPLCDEAEDYARRLKLAAVPTTLLRFDGLVHGFIHMLAVSRACKRALSEIAHQLRTILDAAPEPIRPPSPVNHPG